MNPERATPLTDAQRRAIAHVTAACAGPPLAPDLRVHLQFHPDRLVRGEPILAAMANDGIYRSQFETGTSNGGLTAHPGGDRWQWESRLFGTAYDDAPPAERPRYGALDHRRRARGAAPRFGSAYLRLTAATLARTTFCYPDSVYSPVAFGVAAAMPLIELADADTDARAVDTLDDYVEAHVHGPVRLDSDVEALVLDPSHRGALVEQLASALPCTVQWHPGFRLAVSELERHLDYRGAEIVELGRALAEDGHLDARIIGAAARSGRHDDQALKRVWHYVARFGGPSL